MTTCVYTVEGQEDGPSALSQDVSPIHEGDQASNPLGFRPGVNPTASLLETCLREGATWAQGWQLHGAWPGSLRLLLFASWPQGSEPISLHCVSQPRSLHIIAWIPESQQSSATSTVNISLACEWDQQLPEDTAQPVGGLSQSGGPRPGKHLPPAKGPRNSTTASGSNCGGLQGSTLTPSELLTCQNLHAI